MENGRDFQVRHKKMNLFWAVIFRLDPGRSFDVVLNPNFASIIDVGTIIVSGTAMKDIPKSRSPGSDLDGGPYCVFNTTTNRLQTSGFVSSGFLVTNQDCRTNCELAGCTQYRLDSFATLSYTKLSQCVVAESFHYSLASTKQEQWCSNFDIQKSVFNFRGQSYIVQWYWLGWGTRNDCMNAILCGPTSHYFDPTQSSTLEWCQAVPPGKFSPVCSNNIGDCTSPSWAGGMELAVWTSHGFGQPEGCGIRLLTAAILTGMDVSPITASQWTVSSYISLGSTILPNSEAILFGIFMIFFISIKFISPNTLQLCLFHRDLTVDRDSTVVTSGDIQWFPGEGRTVSVSLNSNRIQFYIDGILVSESSIVAPLLRAAIGRVSVESISSKLTPLVVHVGPVFVQETDFESATTAAPNPYLANTYGPDMSIGRIEFSHFAFSTTTSTSTGTVFIPPAKSSDSSPLTTKTSTLITTITTEVLSSSSSVTTATVMAQPATTVEIPTVSPASSSSPITGLFIAFVVLTIVGICLYIFLKRWRKQKRRGSDPPTHVLFPPEESWNMPPSWWTNNEPEPEARWTSNLN